MKRLTKEILDELVAKGLIESYVLTKSYAAYAYSDEADDYLEEHGYSTDGEICCHRDESELKICYLD